MVKGIIFDLDGTLINTDAIIPLREKREWKRCIGSFSKCHPYEGIKSLIGNLVPLGVRIGVVTNSVSFYSSNLLSHFSISYHSLVSFHDTMKRKPYPDPVIYCCNTLGLRNDEIIAVGDSSSDYYSYKSAEVYSIGAGWNSNMDANLPWDVIYDDPLLILEAFFVNK